MRNLKFILFTFALMATLPILHSCQNDDSPVELLSISTIHTISDSKNIYFTLDNGKTMFPTNFWGTRDYEDGQRAFVIFQEQNERISGYDHSIEVKRIQEILTKEIITMVEDGNTEEKIGDNQINTTYMWITQDNKYLTIEFQYLGTHREDKKHLLNLVINPVKVQSTANDNSDYIDLEFRHNNEGDYPEHLDEGYVSFKLDGINDQIEGKKGIRIRVNTLYNGVKFYNMDFHPSK